ncbi:restriction endonuclease subunit S [Treponema putidum]
MLETNKADLQTAVGQAKRKILDLAIHGKLVPQDLADEPASVMLERLRAEKEAKIAAGEIKRDKNDSYIYKNSTDNCYYQKYTDGGEENISDEIPFAIPEGWAWCRLGELADIERGGSPRPIEDFITDKGNGINWIKIGDTAPESKYIISAKEKIKPEGKKHSRFVHAGDFLLTNSMSFGRPYILKIDGCIHDGWLVFADIRNSLLKDFLYYALSSQYIYNSFSLVAAGSTVKNLKSNTVKQVLFPLPPLAEQQRIVAKIEEMFTRLDFIKAAL